VTDWNREIKAWLKGLNLSPTREGEIVEELAQHVEDRYQDLLADGFTEAEASQTALAELRHSGLLAQDLQRVERPVPQEPAMLGASWLRNVTLGIWQDLRYALRMLVKQRAVTVVAVITMALGIGVNTTLFSTLQLLVYRPFAFANQQRLVMLWEQQPEAGINRGPVAPGNFNDWRGQNHSFEQLVAISAGAFDFADQGQPERFLGNRVSAGFFEALGTAAAVGRTLAAEDYTPDKNQVVVLKHSLWQSRFGADPLIVGHTIKLNGQGFTVVGVMPKGFDFPVGGGDLWVPLVFSAQERAERGKHYLQVIGLPLPGVTVDQAGEDLGAIARRAQQDYPATNSSRGVRVVSLIQHVTRGARVGVPFMFLSVLLVLLVACANVANLLLVRAASRQREIAIRLALGASRFRIMRQLLADSMLLAALGGALGLILSFWGINAIRGIPQDFSKFIPGWEQMGIDQAALVFTFVVSVLTGLLCGLIPALAGTKLDLNEALKEGGRSTSSRGAHRAHHLLVISEVAVSVVLLIGAGVMLKSFAELLRADIGINPDNVLTMQVSLTNQRYTAEQSRAAFYQTLLDRLVALPGVANAGAVGTLPLGYTYNSRECLSIGETVFPQNKRPSITWRVATPDYFDAIGTQLRQGRRFTEDDRPGKPRVALVNEAFAKQFLQNQQALGQHFKTADDEPYEIIGVVANVINDDLDERAEPEIYVPYAQEAWSTLYLVIRADSNPAALTTSVRREVSALDQSAPVFNVKLMDQLVAERLSPKRMAVYGLGSAALIALLLAAVGVYALMSYLVTQQTQEIGLRLALGAGTYDILKLIVRRGMKLVLTGSVIGLAGAWGLTRLLKGLLFGVSAYDPPTFAAIALLLSVVAFVASYLPARRATKLDPMVALRHG
jgi:putative ABC transport system permease protein